MEDYYFQTYVWNSADRRKNLREKLLFGGTLNVTIQMCF